MAKTVRLIKYVNAKCICIKFSSVNDATKWVHNHEGIDIPYSKTRKKRIKNKIKSSILNGILYCGGQWQIEENND